MKPVRLACHAMATRFEIVLFGDDAQLLRAAGEEAIREIKRLHDALSAFRKQSLVSRINKNASDGPVRVTAELFHLLTRVERLWEISDGAFDVTVGPLMSLWGFREPSTGDAPHDSLDDVMSRVGFGHCHLDKRTRSVTFSEPEMQIDLGAIGKGFAIDVAADVLLASGIHTGLLHGGTSTVRAIGEDPSGGPWKVRVRKPLGEKEGKGIGAVNLTDEAMSVSAIAGRESVVEGGMVGHVVDPRSGRPVDGAELAVVVLPTATDADALSTALIVLGQAGLVHLNAHVVGFRGAVVENGRVYQQGDPLETD